VVSLEFDFDDEGDHSALVTLRALWGMVSGLGARIRKQVAMARRRASSQPMLRL
jgi:hypothetical protein